MNDKAAFDRMFKEWYAQLFYFAYQFVGNSEACRDIVSDCYEYLWRNFEKMEEDTVKTYLYTMVRTRCIDHLRHLNIHGEYVEFATSVSDYMAEHEAHEPDSRIQLIRKAMQKLTPYNRRILEECFINRKKYQEVADEFGVSVAAIHKNIVKALRLLHRELGQEG